MMSESMSISVNGQSQVPPGFRFHPTEEELLQYYLRKKVNSIKIDLDVIRDVDLNKLEPWDIQDEGWVVCRIFKKKNLHKTLNSPIGGASLSGSGDMATTSSSSQFFNDDSFEQFLELMGRSCKEELNLDPLMKLPNLESPKSQTFNNNCHVSSPDTNHVIQISNVIDTRFVSSWSALDRLVASQLNGPSISAVDESHADQDHLALPSLRSPYPSLNRSSSYHDGLSQEHPAELELWNTTTSSLSSSSGPFFHVSNGSG
ncbi:hypothetical protein DY000_02036101 [Brassica cretica]|uniref:NAC domain-containing protein n=1 Tax=Brassica cretica TaxID=69181 RepID=A0ABQ7DPM8_BRACR|nr:hypothetical protein DY000_02036101 [Brassica cretica]